jgi:hypothetical protein
LINKPRIPILSGAVGYDITNLTYVELIIVSGEDSVTILPYDPIILPYVDGMAITYFPAAAFIDDVDSL